MTATREPGTKSPSRRALLAGALSGLGAVVASAIGRAAPARATQGDVIHAGDDLTATTVTRLTTTSDTALAGRSSSDTGVYGSSDSLYGVSGVSGTGIGVFGTSAGNKPAVGGRAYGNSTAVEGSSGTGLLPTAKAKTGVYGYANQDGTAKGIYGESPLGFAGYFLGKVYTSKFHEMKEISAPPAPAANKARLFVRDNGSGKTQLCVRFNTGGVLVIKTQP